MWCICIANIFQFIKITQENVGMCASDMLVAVSNAKVLSTHAYAWRPTRPHTRTSHAHIKHQQISVDKEI